MVSGESVGEWLEQIKPYEINHNLFKFEGTAHDKYTIESFTKVFNKVPNEKCQHWLMAKFLLCDLTRFQGFNKC